jgi:hypothetical protein
MATSSTVRLRVFVSYTHDSQELMDSVWSLSQRLRNDGVDCRIDQHEQAPPEGWPRWCSNQVEESQFVLVVCTETYELRFKGKEQPGKGLGGVWEGFVITQELYEAQGKTSKFIPVFFSQQDDLHIPIELRATTRYDLAAPDGYELLFRRITDQPERRPVPVATRVRELPTAAGAQAAPALEATATLPTMERKSPSPNRKSEPPDRGFTGLTWNQFRIWWKALWKPATVIDQSDLTSDEELFQALLFAAFMLAVNFVFYLPTLRSNGVSLSPLDIVALFCIDIGALLLWAIAFYVSGKLLLGKGEFQPCFIAGLYLAAVWPILTLLTWPVLPPPVVNLVVVLVYAYLLWRTLPVAKLIHKVGRVRAGFVALIFAALVWALFVLFVGPLQKRLTSQKHLASQRSFNNESRAPSPRKTDSEVSLPKA